MDAGLFAAAIPLLAIGAFAEVLSNVNTIRAARKRRPLSHDQRNRGMLGETEVERLLENLPDQYAILKNYRMNHRRSKENADFIVIGPNGIFNIEVKAHRAVSIFFSYDGIKINNKDFFKNFIPQVRRQWADITQFLKGNSALELPHTNVQNIIVFTDSHAIKLARRPYWHTYIIESKDLIDVIQKYHSNHSQLNKRQIEALTTILSSQKADAVRKPFLRENLK